MFIDSSFPGGYPTQHGNRRGIEKEREREKERDFVCKTYSPRLCATRND